MTLVVALSVLTGPVVAGILQGALVNVLLAGSAPVPSAGAVTLEASHQVGTEPAVPAGLSFTLVNLSLTILSSVAGQAATLSTLNTNISRTVIDSQYSCRLHSVC